MRVIDVLRRSLGLSAPTDARSGLYSYVYVEVDGTARELHPNERTYLETEFDGADGARPYIKANYKERDGGGELSGYLKRLRLPEGTPIKPAPIEDPNKPLSFDEYIEELRAEGYEVTENSDGTFTERISG